MIALVWFDMLRFALLVYSGFVYVCFACVHLVPSCLCLAAVLVSVGGYGSGFAFFILGPRAAGLVYAFVPERVIYMRFAWHLERFSPGFDIFEGVPHRGEAATLPYIS